MQVQNGVVGVPGRAVLLLCRPEDAEVVTRSGGAVAVEKPSAGAATCRCGHVKTAHQHYRSGTDCALCSCARYGRPLLQRLTGKR